MPARQSFSVDKDEPKFDLNRLGGEAGVTRWITRFYELIPHHPLLGGLFKQDMEESRAKQVAFMVEFFGGPARYTEQYGKAFLRYKHRHLKIGRPERDAWMELIMKCLGETLSDEQVIADVEDRLATLATAMINHDPEKKDAYYFN